MSSLKDPAELARRIHQFAERRVHQWNWNEFIPLIPHRTVDKKWIWLRKAYRRCGEDHRGDDFIIYWEYTTYEDGLFRILKGENYG